MAQAKKNSKKSNNKKNYNRREPYQRTASTENAGARIAMGMVFIILGAITAVCYFIQDGTLIVGFREFLSGVLGYGFWALAVCLIWVAIIIFQGHMHSGIRILCILLIPVLFSSFIDLLSFDASESTGTMDLAAAANILFQRGQDFKCGGVISGILVKGMVGMLSKIGTGIVVFILLVVCVAMAVSEPQAWYGQPQKKSRPSRKSSSRIQNSVRSKTRATTSGVAATLSTIWNGESGGSARPGQNSGLSSLIHMQDDNDGDTLYDLRDDEDSGSLGPVSQVDIKEDYPEVWSVEDEPVPVIAPIRTRHKPAPERKKQDSRPSDVPEVPETEQKPGRIASAGQQEADPNKRKPYANGAEPHEAEPDMPRTVTEPSYRGDSAIRPAQRKPSPAGAAPSRTAASTGRDIKDPEKITRQDANKAARSIAKEINKSAGEDYSAYEFPPTSLLNIARSSGQDSDREIYENRIRLENALHSFGVNSAVVKTTHGPTVTRYDIELEQGVKLTKVTNLSNDIALALGVSNVRIAPIPDEISTVGIEVPNKIVNTVSLREILESENFCTARSKLTFAIGKDIGGNAIVGNISKLPHMLIAGTTGSGKSVCMNSLIISLLYKARPDEVKLIMIDPKMVELGIYNSVPHLYVPVVTEPKKAAGALQWSVVEMLKRYRLFSEVGMRDLSGYNQYCINNGESPLPQVVIVIDELADLMMAASKEVEESICRIAQMGRAAGMHLIIATQRPSADVITGLMKANIPSRIAFAVSSALESRIILDQGGADKLIGMGDMLYAPIGCGKPLRVQGAFVSDEEREKIIRFISTHSTFTPVANDEINQYMDKAMEGRTGADGSDSSSAGGDRKNSGSSLAGEYDEMLPDAVEVVLEMKSCSVSMLQRRLKLGYSRAARIVDQMEELGIVGQYEGAKPRSVPITREDWNAIKADKLGLGSSGDDYALAEEMNE